MNQGPVYSPKIKKTKKVARNLIKTNNIYRLISYEYANGDVESQGGSRATLIFVFGIYKKEIHAIKLNMVKPDIFFRWLKTLSSKIVTQEMINESDLPLLLQESDETGKSFFTSRIKGKNIYKIEPRAYRTYKLLNVKNIEQVYLKEDFLERTFGKPNKVEEEIKDIKKVEEVKAKDKVEEIQKPESRDQPSMDDFIDMTLDILNKK
jgi:hypothetical protein